MKNSLNFLVLVTLFFAIACSSSNDSEPECTSDGLFATSRNFHMGFTSWPYGPDAADVADTYDFISKNADIYVEHIDSDIPWSAWVNNTTLPTKFTDDIAFKKSNTIAGHRLLLSVSVLNIGRNDLANDLDGQKPQYDRLNDAHIIDAYEEHIKYLVNEFGPDYLVISIESNELRINTPALWNDYVLMIDEVRSRVKTAYPSLPISESTTLHNLYSTDVTGDPDYAANIIARMEQMDFVGISYYPYFQGLRTPGDFQQAFNYLHNNISKPIAFVETAMIAEDLVIPDVNISGDVCTQNDYLEVLLNNANTENYEFVIWWCYRDFDRLWETFPAEVKGLGRIWRDTGLLDQDGNERAAFKTWSEAFGK